MIHTYSQPIESLVKEISDGKLLLPEMQRGYVWKSTQVRDLFDSLYRGYPSGQLLVWETDDLPIGNHGASIQGVNTNQRSPRLLLDGQQRLTSLAAVMLKRPLKVKDYDKPIDIAFNVFTEKFEVAGKRHSVQNGWISLSRLFTEGPMTVFLELDLDLKAPETQAALKCVNRLEKIKDYAYHINVLVHMDYDEVTHIFVRTNSGGTKLNNSDLALAQVSSRWHGVTDAFGAFQEDFKKRSWGLELDDGLLLRAIVVILTKQSRFLRLFQITREVTEEQLTKAWERVQRAFDQSIVFLTQNCLIDHLDMLSTRNFSSRL